MENLAAYLLDVGSNEVLHEIGSWPIKGLLAFIWTLNGLFVQHEWIRTFWDKMWQNLIV